MNLVRDLISVVLFVSGFFWVGRNFWTIINNSTNVRLVIPIGGLASAVFLTGLTLAATPMLLALGATLIAIDILVSILCRRALKRQIEIGFSPSANFGETLRLHLINLTQELNSRVPPEDVQNIWFHPEFRRTLLTVKGFEPPFDWIDDFSDSESHGFEQVQGVPFARAKELFPDKCIEVLEAAGISHEDAMNDREKFVLD